MGITEIKNTLLYTAYFWLVTTTLFGLGAIFTFFFGNHHYAGKILDLYDARSTAEILIAIVFSILIFLLTDSLIILVNKISNWKIFKKVPLVITKIICYVLVSFLYPLTIFVSFNIAVFLLSIVLKPVLKMFPLPYSPQDFDIRLLANSVSDAIICALLLLILVYTIFIKNFNKKYLFKRLKQYFLTLLIISSGAVIYGIISGKSIVFMLERYGDTKNYIGITNQFNSHGFYKDHMACDLWVRNQYHTNISKTNLINGTVLDSRKPIYFIGSSQKPSVHLDIVILKAPVSDFQLNYVMALNKAPWAPLYIYEPVYGSSYPYYLGYYFSYENDKNKELSEKYIKNEKIIDADEVLKDLETNYQTFFEWPKGEYEVNLRYSTWGSNCRDSQIIKFTVK